MKIFVNYRTKDEGTTALLVSRYLSERIGEPNVFLDTRSIEPGTLFDDELLKNVWRSDVMVSIMGVNWLDFPGRAGRALDDPDDWIHRELYEALTHQVRVVPLLVGAARFPTVDELPERLVALARHQFVILDLRQPEAGFARLDRVLELPDADDRDEPRRSSNQSGGIGSVRGNHNISVTDPRGSLHIGDRFARPQGDT
ncbi:toll/interleukin-1 receptor domain-containing protein [Actinophytocola sp.]|uniref:toll/interleukin-1 receptor domain-containing protein n=1 Tax=Actinophytocola sp. TaxID=1872138 RepID=UPI002ED1645D